MALPCPQTAISFWLHPAPAREAATEAARIRIAQRGGNIGDAWAGGIEEMAGGFETDVVHEFGVAGPALLEPTLQRAGRDIQTLRYPFDHRAVTRQ